MPAKPVKIGSLSFARKGDANEFFRNMLYKGKIHTFIQLLFTFPQDRPLMHK